MTSLYHFALASLLVPALCCMVLSGMCLADVHTPDKKFSGPPKEPPSRDFDFLHLRLECTLDWDERRVDGIVTHEFRAFRAGLRFVELDAIGLSVDSVTGLGERGLGARELRFESLPETLRIDLGRETKCDEKLSIVIAYEAKPQEGVYF